MCTLKDSGRTPSNFYKHVIGLAILYKKLFFHPSNPIQPLQDPQQFWLCTYLKIEADDDMCLRFLQFVLRSSLQNSICGEVGYVFPGHLLGDIHWYPVINLQNFNYNMSHQASTTWTSPLHRTLHFYKRVLYPTPLYKKPLHTHRIQS